MRSRSHARDHGRRLRDSARFHLPPGMLHQASPSRKVSLRQSEGARGRVCRLRRRSHGTQSRDIVRQSMDYRGCCQDLSVKLFSRCPDIVLSVCLSICFATLDITMYSNHGTDFTFSSSSSIVASLIGAYSILYTVLQHL